MPFLNKIYYGYIAKFHSAWSECPMDFTPSETLLSAWEKDGIVLKSVCLEREGVKMIVETAGGLEPAVVAQRLKGRLQHVLKALVSDFPGFNRDFFLRSLGQNDKRTVAEYVRGQVTRSDLVDPLYRVSLNRLRFQAEPGMRCASTRHGGYDLFLHGILIVGGRYRMGTEEAGRVVEAVRTSSERLGVGLLELSVMPDHLHFLAAFGPKAPPADLLEEVKRDSGEILRRSSFWNEGGYAGTVGPYSLAVALERNAEAGGWYPGRR